MGRSRSELSMAVFHGAFFPSLKFLKKPTNQPTHQDNYGKSFPQLLSRFAPSQPWKTFTHSCLLFAQLRFAHRLDLFIKIKKIKRGMWKKFPTVAQSLRSLATMENFYAHSAPTGRTYFKVICYFTLHLKVFCRRK